MASCVAKYGNEFNFLPYPAGGLTIRPTKTKFMKFDERELTPATRLRYFVARDGIPRG